MGTSQSERKDLWDEAYAELRSENPDLFKKYNSCTRTVEDKQEPEMTYDIDQLQSDRRERYLATLIEKRTEYPREGVVQRYYGLQEDCRNGLICKGLHIPSSQQRTTCCACMGGSQQS